MKQYFSLLVCCFFISVCYGQVSHGGLPLPYSSLKAQLKSSDINFFIEMPSFDVTKLHEEDKINEQDLRGGFRFAHKFFTTIERGKHGLNYQLEDGTKVWQVGIRSQGAYSINVLFGEYKIPEGAKLFIYNANRTHVLGSFTSENTTSSDNILPVQPVTGDEIIIEYTEPKNAVFSGKLRITEVNHDYRNIFLRAGEPEVDQKEYPCMTDAICGDFEKKEIVRSTVLLLINGTTGCSGTLINNTKNDKTPYLLTAMHCLNLTPTVHKNMDYYLDVSGTIVSFFNYQRNACGSTLRGVESQTVAGSKALVVIEKKDIVLLRLSETPPDYYNPYFAGWNIEANGGPNPHINLHHPNKRLKKSGIFTEGINLVTAPFDFEPESHWKIPAWTVGATDGGSSGSPLFDGYGLLIGGLSGGSSACKGTNPNGGADYFFTLYKGWEYGQQDSINLKTWLDPDFSGTKRLAGLDPYAEKPMVRLTNADYNGIKPDVLTVSTVSSGTESFFGHNSLQETIEFAESFYVDSETEFIGTYIMTPPVAVFDAVASPVKINIYSGENGPQTKLDSVIFNPQYTYFNVSKRDFESYPVSMKTGGGTENFVVFPDKIKVKGNFYVSYEITYPSDINFTVYNTTFSSKKKNTAWIKRKTGEWISADKYPEQPITTSLAIEPLVIKVNTPVVNPEDIRIAHYDRTTNRLHLNVGSEETGTVTVYSVSGQALYKFNFFGSQTFTIIPVQRGSVGVVKVASNIRTKAVKVVF